MAANNKGVRMLPIPGAMLAFETMLRDVGTAEPHRLVENLAEAAIFHGQSRNERPKDTWARELETIATLRIEILLRLGVRAPQDFDWDRLTIAVAAGRASAKEPKDATPLRLVDGMLALATNVGLQSPPRVLGAPMRQADHRSMSDLKSELMVRLRGSSSGPHRVPGPA
jgi:hypothetical protein